MAFAWLSCLIVCLSAVQDDNLEITNPRRTYGYLGAPRPKEMGILPGDTAHFSFDIKNLKMDESGKASYSVAIEIRDENGKVFYEQRPYRTVAQNLFGGNSMPCSAHVAIPVDAKPGVVDWKVTVIDRATKKSAVASGKGRVLPLDFGIVGVGLFSDPEARVPMSAIAVVGDLAYLHLATVGFQRSKDSKQPHVEVSLRVLDETGKPTTAKPIVGTINSNVDPKEQFLPVQFGLSVTRPGRFTIELTAQDKLSGKRSQVSYGLRVLPLE